MSYYIDIIDTTSPLNKLVIEQASGGGIQLSWNGGDKKDGMSIVSSELSFDMLDKTARDAAFIAFFTGDEHRFKVKVLNYEDDSVIWQGYILPDLYSEPYKNGNIFVNFVATDGLGRIKGKYLPEDYYSREKSLIDIYCQCLKLTGIELPLYFNPAIENFINKDWNTIFIDTATFADKDKKQNAYTILETLLKDTFCVCYQADNRWYIEGINTRHVRQVKYKIYGTDGVYINTVDYSRALKQITALVTPQITIIPPYNEITITHKKTEPSLPKTLAKEVNDGWAVVTGVKAEIHANDWMANGGFYSKCMKPEYAVIVYNKYFFTGSLTDTYPQDDTQWISLKEKLFFSKGQKLSFSFEFKIAKFNESIPKPDNMDLWKDPFKYEIVFNDVVIYSNFGGTIADQERLIFEENETAKLAIEHIVAVDGLLDIKIYGPPGKVFDTKILGIEITKLDLGVIAFQEEEIITDVINGDFTIDAAIDLTYADDKSGQSKGFRLYKLKENSAFFNEYTVLIFNGFALDGKYYSVVQLEGAKLIKENPYAVYNGGIPVTVLNVYYNFNDGEQMVVETAVPYTSGEFTVKKYAVNDVIANRTNWQQWTDAIYKIENTSFAKTVANIYRRMFNAAHEKLDCTAKNAVKFNDIILFDYVYVKDFIVLNSSWNLDNNKTTLTLGRSYYKDANSTAPGDDNIPPIVLAGEDVYLENSQTTAALLATAYDPDGYIDAQVWTKTLGGFGDVIETPFQLATNLQNLTEDFYTYQIQVTDNDGATAIDTVNVIRKKDYAVTLDFISETETATSQEVSKAVKYKLNISPGLPEGFILKLTGYFELSELTNASVGDYGSSGYLIEKNGYNLEARAESQGIYRYPLTLNIINTDVIYITLSASASHGDLGTAGNVDTTLKVEKVEITSGTGTIVGVPITKVVSVQLT